MVLLQERQKWHNIERSLKLGDLVLVTDVSLPRNQWPLGRVSDVRANKSGEVRSAFVKIAKNKFSQKDFRCNIIHRPISKLIMLRCVEDLKFSS